MSLIGLSGYAQSGKDTFADIAKDYGFSRVAFADVLREALYRLNPLVTVYGDDLTTVREVVDARGWEWAKAHTDQVRGYLQRLGTEVGRELIYGDVWVDAALSPLAEDGNYVITDMRFPNELAAVRDRKGVTVRIERAGRGPANAHPSETSLDNEEFDTYIHNDGTLADFETKVRRFFDAQSWR